MKNTFHQKVFFISTLLHAEKRSLKRPLFKFEKNKKNDLDSRPYSSKTIIRRSFNFTLNFSSGIRLQFMFLEDYRKMNFKGSYAIFPKPSEIFTVQPHRRVSPASPYLPTSNTISFSSVLLAWHFLRYCLGLGRILSGRILTFAGFPDIRYPAF